MGGGATCSWAKGGGPPLPCVSKWVGPPPLGTIRHSGCETQSYAGTTRHYPALSGTIRQARPWGDYYAGIMLGLCRRYAGIMLGLSGTMPEGDFRSRIHYAGIIRDYAGTMPGLCRDYASQVLDVATRGPHVVARGPHVAERGPQVAARGPHVAARGPHVAARGPHVAARGPHVAARDTHVAARDPHVAARGPHVVARGPHVGPAVGGIRSRIDRCRGHMLQDRPL